MLETRSIMLKNLLDACVGAVGFWAIGYGVAYGAEVRVRRAAEEYHAFSLA
jgi:ammonia channel protein AmtB